MPTFDNAAAVALNSSGANTTSFTCSGNNRILFYGGINDVDNITAITYATVAMTKFTTTVGHFYYLVAPASGANTLSVTRSGTSLDGEQSIISFSDASQSAPLVNSSFTNLTGSKTGYSNSPTSTTANSMFVDFFSLQSDPTSSDPLPAATGTGHLRKAYQYLGGGAQTGEGVGITPTTTAGSYPVGYSWSTTNAIQYSGETFEVLPVTTTSGFNIALV